MIFLPLLLLPLLGALMKGEPAWFQLNLALLWLTLQFFWVGWSAKWAKRP